MFGKKAKKEFSGGGEFMIVGLGNPGREYEATRHNMGWLVLDILAKRHSADIKKLKAKSLIGECRIGGRKVLLVKPQTFMNLSGQAVAELMNFYKIPAENVLIIFDDVSLDAGRLRIRRNGSDGGHNGMKNIIYLSGTDTFPRIKVGVGKKPHPEYDMKDWVLSTPKGEDAEKIKSALEKAADAAEDIAANGDIDRAMNLYNA
ncbi:MAG: aminoacyl-tRNA hydrolase [Clostridia bacterium]|nr:aminoacyl-tRNA hydrolase [Clostridia bacterium]